MAEYNALYTAADSTDLSAYTSDSGHTHSKESGSGSIQIVGNALRAITSSQSAFYTVDMTPSDADYELEWDFFVDTADAIVIGMGIRCETDGDGVFVVFDGFNSPDRFLLQKVVGGSDTAIDSFNIPDLTDAPYNIRLAGSGGNVQWWVDDADQGTHSLGGDLAAAGLIGFTKFSQSTDPSEDVRILNAATTGADSGAPPITDATEKLRVVRSNLRLA
jgi:hypothetical protein